MKVAGNKQDFRSNWKGRAPIIFFLRKCCLYSSKIPKQVNRTIFLVFVLFGVACSEESRNKRNYQVLNSDDFQQYLTLDPEAFRQVKDEMTVLHRGGQVIWRKSLPGVQVGDSNLGSRNRTHTKIKNIWRTESEILGTPIYTLDEYGRRGPELNQNSKYDKFISIFGCSFTFGDAVDDNETISFFLGQKNPNFHVYNYGISGAGTNKILALIEENQLPQQILEKFGYFVYIFLDDEGHVERATGKWPSLTWLSESPYYEPVGDELVRRGSFWTGRQVSTLAYLAVGKVMQAFEFLGINAHVVFPRLSRDDYLTTCKMIKKMKDTLLHQFPGSKFLVYVHPVSKINPITESCFKENSIAYYRNRDFQLSNDMFVKHDGHMNAIGNKLVADDIYRNLK